MLEWFSTWSVIKASGLTSYLLLFLSVSLGMFSYGKLMKPNIRGSLLIMHQLSGWIGFLFGLLHGLVLTIDSYQPFSYKDVFVPFAAEYHPLSSGLGTIALYLFVIILVTSDWMKNFGRKVWRAIHYLAFPAFVLSLVHGLAAGSDTKQLWAQLFYLGTAVLFLIFVYIRVQYAADSSQTSQESASTENLRRARTKSAKRSGQA
ncbi:ferric reductase-like transmembrane domain-containing protein [Ferviditalea candida]|uniref:Ferric reductase-like transmembrane domain-containing protein n=1 Tax=Ferviditalea candida TaxID=3108399 RepID=A0ABU5ZI55_9BACL|nr:ferric reductase-like transmembrane domain-containing protein [Paenibacillaceae bacterium T2]